MAEEKWWLGLAAGDQPSRRWAMGNGQWAMGNGQRARTHTDTHHQRSYGTLSLQRRQTAECRMQTADRRPQMNRNRRVWGYRPNTSMDVLLTICDVHHCLDKRAVELEETIYTTNICIKYYASTPANAGAVGALPSPLTSLLVCSDTFLWTSSLGQIHCPTSRLIHAPRWLQGYTAYLPRYKQAIG